MGRHFTVIGFHPSRCASGRYLPGIAKSVIFNPSVSRMKRTTRLQPTYVSLYHKFRLLQSLLCKESESVLGLVS